MPGIKKPTVLFINHWALELGGPEQSLLDLFEEAVKRAEVYLVSSENGPLVEQARACGVTCKIIHCSVGLRTISGRQLVHALFSQWRSIFSFLAFVMHLHGYVAKLKPHTIHANTPISHIALLLLQRFGYSGSAVYHCRKIFERPSAASLLYSILFSGKDTTIIAVSEAVRSALPVSMRIRARVIYDGVPIFPNRKKETPKPDDDTYCGPAFLFLGGIVPWNLCQLLVEAFSKVVVRYGPYAGTLSLAGGTPARDFSYRNQIEALIQSTGLHNLCRLLPYPAEPHTLLLDHDVLCITSEQDSFGRIIAEAQGCGMPVVAFKGGSIDEIIEHEVTGIQTTFGDTDAFANAMSTFIEKPERIAFMGAAAQARASLVFNQTINAPKIVDAILGTTDKN